MHTVKLTSKCTQHIADYYHYSLATAERVPVTEVMIDVSSLEAALKGEAP